MYSDCSNAMKIPGGIVGESTPHLSF